MKLLKDCIGFGIAGNFANHLEQAGEDTDFVDIKTDENDAPKGIFPTYICSNSTIFLDTFPFSSKLIDIHKMQNIQVEPEVGLVFEIDYKNNKIETIKPTHFMAYNDCSIRQNGIDKISKKKNWGANSKGVSENWIGIDEFSSKGAIDSYSLTSFILRDNQLIQYGENSTLNSYSYFYDKLTNWLVDKMNNQQDIGPLEDIYSLIAKGGYPKKCIVSIGATRYTDFGEKNYLKKGDIIFVVVYNHTLFTHKDIISKIEDKTISNTKNISVLEQIVG